MLIGTAIVLEYRAGALPSAHTAFVASVFGLAGSVAFDAGHRALTASLWLCVALLGPALVVLGAHLPSDVIAGYCLGLAWCLAVLHVARLKQPPANADPSHAVIAGSADAARAHR